MLERSFQIRLLLLTAVTGTILVFLSFTLPYDIDELDQIHVGWLVSQGLRVREDFHDHPLQAYKWILSGLIPLCGEKSLLPYRWISIAMALAALVIYSSAIKRILGPWRALAGFGLLALSYGFLFRAPQARSDMLVLLGLAISIWLVVAFLQDGGSARLVGAGVAAGIACALRPTTLSFPFSTALVFAVRALRAGRGDRRGAIAQPALFAGAAALSAATVFLIPYQIRDIEELRSLAQYFAAQFVLIPWTDRVGPDTSLFSVGRSDMVVLFAGLLGLVALVRELRMNSTRRSALPLLLLIVQFFMYAPLLIWKGSFYIQDLLPTFFCAASLAGGLIPPTFPRKTRRGSIPWISTLLITAVAVYLGVGTARTLIIMIQQPQPRTVKMEQWAQCAAQHGAGRLFGLDQLASRRCVHLAPSLFDDMHVSRQETERIKDLFLEHTDARDYCYSRDSSHLFRRNPPSFNPPSPVFLYFIDQQGKLYSIQEGRGLSEPLFRLPPWDRWPSVFWKESPLSLDERLTIEFERFTPKLILVDAFLIKSIEQYPLWGRWLMYNYVASYDTRSASIFGYHRRLAAREIDEISRGTTDGGASL